MVMQGRVMYIAIILWTVVSMRIALCVRERGRCHTAPVHVDMNYAGSC